MSKLFCSVCGKSLSYSKDISGIVAFMIGYVQASPEKNEFVQSLYGKYDAKKDYCICHECLLKALGVKP